MGIIRTPLPVKLFVGMLSSAPALFDECASLLSAAYGRIDHTSDVFPWDTSEYYRDEMGDGIHRKFIFFDELIDPAQLSEIKIFTNEIESCFCDRKPSGTYRRINLDPGYVTEAKVVLASTKDFSHRIYIGSGVYAEVTLRYSIKERSFMTLDHTYFDFRTDPYRLLFNEARKRLRDGLKGRGKS